MTNVDLFGFKDPRTSLLLPFWQQVFAEMELREFYIIAVRNPLEIAPSLAKRDGFSELKSVLLWSKYLFDSLQYTSEKSSIVVSYENLLQFPAEQLQRLANALNSSDSDKNVLTTKQFVQDFISSDLRHSTATEEQLLAAGYPDFVIDLYQYLQNQADAKILPGQSVQPPHWQSARENFEQLTRFFSQMDMLNERVHHLEYVIGEKNKELQDTRNLETVSDKEKLIGLLQDYEAQISELNLALNFFTGTKGSHLGYGYTKSLEQEETPEKAAIFDHSNNTIDTVQLQQLRDLYEKIKFQLKQQHNDEARKLFKEMAILRSTADMLRDALASAEQAQQNLQLELEQTQAISIEKEQQANTQISTFTSEILSIKKDLTLQAATLKQAQQLLDDLRNQNAELQTISNNVYLDREYAEKTIHRERFFLKRIYNGIKRLVLNDANLSFPFDFIYFLQMQGLFHFKEANRLAQFAHKLRKGDQFDQRAYLAENFEVRVNSLDPVRHFIANNLPEK